MTYNEKLKQDQRKLQVTLVEFAKILKISYDMMIRISTGRRIVTEHEYTLHQYSISDSLNALGKSKKKIGKTIAIIPHSLWGGKLNI